MPAFVTSVTTAQAAWARSLEEIGRVNIPRAAAFAVNGAVLEVRDQIPRLMEAVLDRPKPYSRKVWKTDLADFRNAASMAEVTAAAMMHAEQSTWLKYQFGRGIRQRMPGDVGLDRTRILIPDFKALSDTQGIKPDKYGNVPGGAVRRLLMQENQFTSREQRLKGLRATSKRWGVFDGEVKFKSGRTIKGIIARPPKERVEVTRRVKRMRVNSQGRLVPTMVEVKGSYWRNTAPLRVLFYEVSQAAYPNEAMQAAVDEASLIAAQGIPARFEAELDALAQRLISKGIR